MSDIRHIRDASYLNRIGDDCFRLILQYTQIQTMMTASLISQRTYQVINHIATQYLPTITLDLSQSDLCWRYSKSRISTMIFELKIDNYGDHDDNSILYRSKYLRVLDLSRRHLKRLKLARIKEFTGCLGAIPQLRSLNLSGNNLGVDGIRVLAPHLTSCPHLLFLDLSLNILDTEAMSVLASNLTYCPRLQTLNLRWNEIGLEGIRVLTPHLSSLPFLQTLNLSCNGIGAEGVSILTQGLALCPQLQILHLGGNNLGDEGIKILASQLTLIPKLLVLDLTYTRTSGWEILSDLIRQYPNISILY